MNKKPAHSFIITFLIVSIFVVGAGRPILAQASGVPTVDVIANLILGKNLGTSLVNTSMNTMSKVQQFYEWAQSFALSALKAQLVGTLQDKVVGFVNGGGQQKFVTNWVDYFGKVKQGAAEFADGSLAQSDFCPHFKDQILGAVGANGASGGSKISSVNCDFSQDQIDSLRQNPLSMTEDEYNKLLKPQNRMFDSLLKAQGFKDSVVVEAEKAAEREAVAGGGFLSARDGSGGITTPGSVLKDITSKAAGADFELIVNAEQLKDIVGIIGKSMISELTQGGDNGGLSGVDVPGRRRRRNNSQGDLATAMPDCGQVVLESMSDDDRIAAGVPEDATTIDPEDIPSDFETLYESCLLNASALTSSGAFSTTNKIKQLLEDRKTAQKNFDEYLREIRRMPSTLSNYATNSKAAYKYRIDNPIYTGGTCTPAEVSAARSGNKSGASACPYLYFTGPVYSRRCFDADALREIIEDNDLPLGNSGRAIQVKKRAFGEKTLWIAEFRVGSYSIPYYDATALRTKGLISGTADNLFKVGINATPTTNPSYDGKTIRCTVDVKNNAGILIESAYYQGIDDDVATINRANDIAVNKLAKLDELVDAATHSKPANTRGQKLQKIMNDFNCHADRNECTIRKEDGSTKQLFPLDPSVQPGDADQALNEAGFYDTAGVWNPVPSHAIIPTATLGRIDTYSTILNSLGLTGYQANLSCPEDSANIICVLRRGLTTNVSNNSADDPSNELYEPAFDDRETDNVLKISEGNLETLSGLGVEVDVADDGAAGSETTEAPDSGD